MKKLFIFIAVLVGSNLCAMREDVTQSSDGAVCQQPRQNSSPCKLSLQNKIQTSKSFKREAQSVLHSPTPTAPRPYRRRSSMTGNDGEKVPGLPLSRRDLPSSLFPPAMSARSSYVSAHSSPRGVDREPVERSHQLLENSPQVVRELRDSARKLGKAGDTIAQVVIQCSQEISGIAEELGSLRGVISFDSEIKKEQFDLLKEQQHIPNQLTDLQKRVAACEQTLQVMSYRVSALCKKLLSNEEQEALGKNIDTLQDSSE